MYDRYLREDHNLDKGATYPYARSPDRSASPRSARPCHYATVARKVGVGHSESTPMSFPVV